MCRVIAQCDNNGCVAGKCDGTCDFVKDIFMRKCDRTVDVC